MTRALIAVLAALAFVGCAKCPDPPPPTPPGYVCGPSKMYCKAYVGQEVMLPRHVALTMVNGTVCLGRPGAMLVIEAVSGTQAAAAYKPTDVPKGLDCGPGRAIISVCEFFELTRDPAIRAADRQSLVTPTPPR